MSRLTYLAADLLTNDVIAELPLKGVSFNSRLKDIGTFDGNLPIGDPKQDVGVLINATQPARTALYVDLDGELVWGGILWGRSYDTDSASLKLTGEEFGSYLSRRFIQSRVGMLYPSGGAFRYRPSGDVFKSLVFGVPNNTDIWRNFQEPKTINNYGTKGFIRNTLPGPLFIYEAKWGIPSGDLEGTTITGVTISAWMFNTKSNFSSIQPTLVINGNRYVAGLKWMGYPGGLFSYTWSRNPSTNRPWTDEEVEQLGSDDSAGFVANVPNAGQDLTVIDMELIVKWEGTRGGRIRFDQVDQIDIAKDILRHVQEGAAGDIGLLTDENAPTGVTRDRTYFGFELKESWEAIVDLSNIINGFDFHIEVDYGEGHHPRKRLVFSYPERGRPPLASNLAFDYWGPNKGNLRKYSYPEDGTRVSTVSHAIGAGEGDEMLIAASANWDLIAQGYPILEETFSYKDVSEWPTLQGHADADIAALKFPFTNPTLSITVDAPPYNSYTVGDQCLVNFKDGRFPLGHTETYRVLGKKLNADNMMVDLELGKIV